jgi:ligand-binding sensor domain-containing protein
MGGRHDESIYTHALRSMLLTLFIIIAQTANASNGILYTSGKLTCSQMSCLCQDRYGFIWVGTEYGLNKFDGYHFTNYFFDRNRANTINSNDIATIISDHEGNLWIGTSKGLCRYDYHHDDFIRYPMAATYSKRVSAILEMHNGDIMIGTSGNGLYCIKKGTDKVVKNEAITGKEGFLFKTFRGQTALPVAK